MFYPGYEGYLQFTRGFDNIMWCPDPECEKALIVVEDSRNPRHDREAIRRLARGVDAVGLFVLMDGNRPREMHVVWPSTWAWEIREVWKTESRAGNIDPVIGGNDRACRDWVTVAALQHMLPAHGVTAYSRAIAEFIGWDIEDPPTAIGNG